MNMLAAWVLMASSILLIIGACGAFIGLRDKSTFAQKTSAFLIAFGFIGFWLVAFR